jgi:pimeloyl-ACP methyl ester carboxylesterase
VPVYFFAGRYDYNTPTSLIESYFQQLDAPAGKRLIWFENSAHDLFFDEPDKVEAEMLAILEGQ